MGAGHFAAGSLRRQFTWSPKISPPVHFVAKISPPAYFSLIFHRKTLNYNFDFKIFVLKIEQLKQVIFKAR